MHILQDVGLFLFAGRSYETTKLTATHLQNLIQPQWQWLLKKMRLITSNHVIIPRLSGPPQVQPRKPFFIILNNSLFSF